MSDLGWIKLHRKTLRSALWENPNAFRLFCWMLLRATHKPRTTSVGSQRVELSEGQLIFGRKMAAKETGLSEQQIRTALRFMSGHECATKVTNKYSIVTIVNWTTYQCSEVVEQPTNNQQITNKQPLNKNVKNEKNTPPHLRLAENSKHPLREKPKPAGWDIAEDAMRRWVPRYLTGGNYVAALDSFWQDVECESWIDDDGAFVLEAIEAAIEAGATPHNPKGAGAYLAGILQRCSAEQCRPGAAPKKRGMIETHADIAERVKHEMRDV